MFGCLILDVCKSWCRNLLLINIRWHSFLSIIPPTAKENKANKGLTTVGLSTKENAGIFNQELFNESSVGELPNGWVRADKYDGGLVQLIFWLNNLKVREYLDDGTDFMTVPYGFQADQQFAFSIGQSYLWSDADNGDIKIISCEKGWIRGTVLYHTNQ